MESGDFNTTYPAFGYRISDNELIVNEDEAKTVRTIFALYLQGMGKQAIANTLNANNIPSRKGNGIASRWTIFLITRDIWEMHCCKNVYHRIIPLCQEEKQRRMC